MQEFTREEIIAAFEDYQERRDELIAQAEADVVEWKFANTEMFDDDPFAESIGKRLSSGWKKPNRKWYKKQPKGDDWRKHGLDANGKIRCILNCYGTTALVRLRIPSKGFVDEICLRGCPGGYASLIRWIYDGDVVRVRQMYSVDHGGVHKKETYGYNEDGLCIKSVLSCSFVSQRTLEWEDIGWQEVFVYDYDEKGLLRVTEVDSPTHRGETHVHFIRPKTAAEKRAAKASRRLFVAYAYPTDYEREIEDEPGYEVSEDARGLMWNFDDEWPVDAAVLHMPELIPAAIDDVDFEDIGVALGVSSPPADGDYGPLQKAKVIWQLVDGSLDDALTQAQTAVGAGFKILHSVTKKEQIAVLGEVDGLTAERLVVAFRSDDEYEPKAAQKQAKAVRKVMMTHGFENSRVVMGMVLKPEMSLDRNNVMDYLDETDLDGLLVYDGTFDWVTDILTMVAMHRQ